jgi:hypothetical protein
LQINETPQDTQPKEVKKPFIPWEGQERVRPKWVAQKHGETILPQSQQKSNNDLTDAQVLQPRDEPVGENSQATPIDGRHDSGHGVSDHDSGSKKTYPTSGGIAL